MITVVIVAGAAVLLCACTVAVLRRRGRARG
ncbi:hypothetical protein JOF58_002743 [Streptomyces cinnamonensis]|nr:hypothetical protein [Streptomyces virginiae]